MKIYTVHVKYNYIVLYLSFVIVDAGQDLVQKHFDTVTLNFIKLTSFFDYEGPFRIYYI